MYFFGFWARAVAASMLGRIWPREQREELSFKDAMTGVAVQSEGMTELSPDSARRSGNENALLGQKRGQK